MKFCIPALLFFCLNRLAVAATPAPLAPTALASSSPVTVSAAAEPTALAPPSSSAQRLYLAAKNDLLQLRSLLKNGRDRKASCRERV